MKAVKKNTKIRSVVNIALAGKMKSAREAANMKQEELANKLGITKVTVSLYETGKLSMPVFMAMQIATALKIDVRELLPSQSELKRISTMLETNDEQQASTEQKEG